MRSQLRSENERTNAIKRSQWPVISSRLPVGRWAGGWILSCSCLSAAGFACGCKSFHTIAISEAGIYFAHVC